MEIINKLSDIVRGQLNPWFITGFTDAEGSFSVSIFKNNRRKIGYEIQVNFTVGLHIKDSNLLLKLKSFFNETGKIFFDEKKNKALYNVRDLKSINEIIIPHFNLYPLISQKQEDFLIFSLRAKKIVEALRDINNKQHLEKMVL